MVTAISTSEHHAACAFLGDAFEEAGNGRFGHEVGFSLRGTGLFAVKPFKLLNTKCPQPRATPIFCLLIWSCLLLWT